MPLRTQTIPMEQLCKFAEGGYLCAIIDSSDVPEVPTKMNELGEQCALSLLKGTIREEYWALAPYLVKVDLELLDWITKRLWTIPWGIFVLAKAGLSELRQHFQQFLVVKLPDGREWFFRYYDPRVLPTFLSTCQPDELRQFFGPVRGYAVAERQIAAAAGASTIAGQGAATADVAADKIKLTLLIA